MDKRTYLWNKLNQYLADLCAEDAITELEYEAVLDDPRLQTMDGLEDRCKLYGLMPKDAFHKDVYS